MMARHRDPPGGRAYEMRAEVVPGCAHGASDDRPQRNQEPQHVRVERDFPGELSMSQQDRRQNAARQAAAAEKQLAHERRPQDRQQCARFLDAACQGASSRKY